MGGGRPKRVGGVTAAVMSNSFCRGIFSRWYDNYQFAMQSDQISI